MKKIISLEDRIREERKKIRYEHKNFPIFEGRILTVVGETISSGKTFSILDYIPSGVNIPEPLLALVITGTGREDYEDMFDSVSQRVHVPFSVNPLIVEGRNVKGYIKEIEDDHLEYILEVLADQRLPKSVVEIDGHDAQNLTDKYRGFRYTVTLSE